MHFFHISLIDKTLDISSLGALGSAPGHWSRWRAYVDTENMIIICVSPRRPSLTLLGVMSVMSPSPASLKSVAAPVFIKANPPRQFLSRLPTPWSDLGLSWYFMSDDKSYYKCVELPFALSGRINVPSNLHSISPNSHKVISQVLLFEWAQSSLLNNNQPNFTINN